MTMILVHRLELAIGPDLALDADILHWLAEDVGMGQGDIWLRHTRNLTGDLGGAHRLRSDLFPNAAWHVGQNNAGAGRPITATLVPAGLLNIITGASADPANALLAAVIRAQIEFGTAYERAPLERAVA